MTDHKQSIEREAEELLRKCLNANKDDTEPEATSSEFTEPALTNKLRNEIKKFLAGASRSDGEKWVSVISDEAIEKAFKNTKFGSTPRHEVLIDSLKKYATGYSTGHTATVICKELGLIESTFGNLLSPLPSPPHPSEIKGGQQP